MPTGVVKFFSEHKGFGFIAPDAEGEDIFFHITDCHGDLRDGEEALQKRLRVSFDATVGDRDGRPRARNVKALD